MPNFTSAITAQIVNTDGSKLVFSTPAQVSNGKLIKDDVVPAGTYDLEPLLADLESPQTLLIVFADPTGFTVSIDGAVHSTQKLTMFMMQSNGAVAMDVEIITTAQGRLQVYALGDPT